MFQLFIPADIAALKERVGRLTEWMKDNCADVALISDPVYRRYLIDEKSEDPAISVLIMDRAGTMTQITGQGRGASHAEGLELEVITFVDYSIEQWATPAQSALNVLSRLLRRYKPRKIAFDYGCTALSNEFIRLLADTELCDVRSFLSELRIAKAPYEVERIRRAGSVNEAAYESVRRNLSDGMTELDLFSIMSEKAISNSQYQVNFIGKSDLVSGNRTMNAGGPPTSRQLQSGDAVIVDLFPGIHGYYADNCRSFVVGEPTALQRTIHQTVLSALKVTETLLIPGNRASDIFHEVNEELKKIGYDYSLFHHLGHGIGVQDQEAPYLIPGSSEILAEGMVVSVEPGIYIEGQGVRIENAYYIGKNGPENLTPFSADL
jgi:Xaa-Pro aminopeptidase